MININNPIPVHFIGIGGVSMSGLAEILLSHNFTISGSDIRESETTLRLQSKGVTIMIPQTAENIKSETKLVVYTAAIHPDNPEFIRARELNIPMMTRAQLLGAIMGLYENSIAISGTHGKTTTTSMVSEIMLKSNGNPTISVGGTLPSIGSNVLVGDSDLFITEACEYTNSFLEFYPKYNAILNIEEDHLDFFKDINDIRKSFKQFANNTQNEGAIFINGSISDYKDIVEGTGCDIYTFGLSEEFDCYPKNLCFEDGVASFIPVFKNEAKEAVRLSVPGEHNATNALCAIALSLVMGIPFDCIKDGLLAFRGADRRFQLKGMLGDLKIIDDYAHHPTEITATIKAARSYKPNHLTVIFQPHTYTRTKAFFDDFAKALSAADTIVLADIYAARETDTLGMSSKKLCEAIKELGCDAHYFSSFDEIKKFIKNFYMHSGMLITMGAGNVNIIGDELLSE